MKRILEETQLDRDTELSIITNVPLSQIQAIKIASPDSIRIFDGENINLNRTELENLYKEYKSLNFVAYLKTLMYTSVKRRHPELIKLLKAVKNKQCLDFGCGVGTHTIALLENNNKVNMLDVEGSPLKDFACKRILLRNYGIGVVLTFGDKITLANDFYEVIICTDVLEHVYNPILELFRITCALKKGGILHLQVSTMIKNSSGHFEKSINQWKKEGDKFLQKYYTKLGETIYKKK